MADRWSSINRRNVLKTIGGIGVGLGASQIGVSASTIEKSVNKIDTNEYVGKGKEKVIQRAKKDFEFKKLLKHYKKEGYRLDKKNGSAIKVNAESTSYNHVVGVLEHHKINAPRKYITWFDIDLSELDIDDEGYNAFAYEIGEKSEGDVEVIRKVADGNGVKSNSDTLSIGSGGIGTRDNMGPGGGGGCTGCWQRSIDCDSYNWDCILQIAGAYITAAGTCASCTIPQPVCLACIGTLVGSVGVSIGCEVGNNCITQMSCFDPCPSLPS
ncbi:hypothetical protein [Halocatena halophila]|uniref:hypothetical protein n=1 Tax=Halocatena halophila TaxID=2814576 RepID=UPI002ED2241E